jgi:hypothetical protein
MQHNLKTDPLPDSYPEVLFIFNAWYKMQQILLSSPRLKSNTNIPILISV